MNKQDSAQTRPSSTSPYMHPDDRHVPKDDRASLAWHRAGLDTDFGILIVGAPGLGKSVMSKRLLIGRDTDDPLPGEAD